MTFSAQLRAERERLGLTQTECATLLDVSPRAVWQWEHGRAPLEVTKEGVLARLKTEWTRVFRPAWATVDWQQQDVVIADAMRVSRARVGQVRKFLNKPRSKNFKHKRE